MFGVWYSTSLPCDISEIYIKATSHIRPDVLASDTETFMQEHFKITSIFAPSINKIQLLLIFLRVCHRRRFPRLNGSEDSPNGCLIAALCRRLKPEQVYAFECPDRPS